MGDSLPTVNLGTGRTALAISTGYHHTCALLDNQSVKCWGRNLIGELGLGDELNRGDDQNEMGDALPAVTLGTGTKPLIVSTGGAHTCVLLEGGSVKCWGDNRYGVLGRGNTKSVGGSPGQMGDNLPVVDLGLNQRAAALWGAGTDSGNACVLLESGKLKCWGNGFMAIPAQGDKNHRGDQPNEMGDNLPPIDLGTGRGIRDFSVGGSAACALLDNDGVKCWGLNAGGLLGLLVNADELWRGDQPGEMGDNLPYMDL